MNVLEILIGQIPEAIYFALFLIFTKQLKEKRILFTIVMILEYLLAMNISKFSINAHVFYTLLVFITLKVIYKDKAQITDVFTFGISSIVLIGISAISFVLCMPNTLLVIIMSRIILFTIVFLLRNKLMKIQELYKKLWNRNNNGKTKMKSTTFRSLNVVVFNFMFYIINLGMIYALLMKK